MSAMISFLHLRRAAQIIHDGGVIAYPTEGVFGFGCDPGNRDAAMGILALKERTVTAGLILLAAERRQLDGWINPSAAEDNALSGTTDLCTTWVVTADPGCPEWITGGRSTCAVRITRHPVAAALCRTADLPLVSTSVNRHGHSAAVSALAVRRQFGRHIDFVLPGDVINPGKPSEIRVAETGMVLRAG